jgi:hypothetical protein
LECFNVGLDSQAALSICVLLRKLAQHGLAILCAISQPSARLMQTFDRLILLAKGGRQLYFGKTGPSCKTMTRYFERHGARPCNADENPAEWVFEVTGSIPNSDGPEDWSEIWKNSEEHKAVKSKLSILKQKFSEEPKSINGLDATDTLPQSVAGFDALALQRKFITFDPPVCLTPTQARFTSTFSWQTTNSLQVLQSQTSAAVYSQIMLLYIAQRTFYEIMPHLVIRY